ncbi:similar to Saccharomyces cerevisiae YBR092C PHO3 Constitutively expressed acid phosphatase similar to Pho5p [Geotrichum candidum]|nr:similar to Saccharomyces cerevisiae YBR092C PHO3 Constitutively expressed acid phosphatase similar to Pho5p [Geotrichum candidum]
MILKFAIFFIGSLCFLFYVNLATPTAAEQPSSAFSQVALDQFNLFQHTGGIGPYVQYKGFGLPFTTAPQLQCTLKQVHLLARHTERYPTPEKTFSRTIAKLQAPGIERTGALQFLDTYKYFITDPYAQYGRLTYTGPYNGVDHARNIGKQFRARYNNLYSNWTFSQFLTSNNADKKVLPVFAGSSTRVLRTAELFMDGFFEPHEGKRLISISERPSSGGNSLTPDKACPKYDREHAHVNYHKFFKKYFAQTRARIQANLSWKEESSAIEVTFEDTQNLIEMCYFELNTNATSDFCGLFTDDEHVLYGYTRALRYYYRNGPGNPLSANMGSIYAKGLYKLLTEPESSSTLPFYFSFAHDTQLNFFLAFLGIFDGKDNVLDYESFDVLHPWVHGLLTPMGANIVFEKLACGDDGDAFIRLIINESVIPIPGCQTGPGLTCPIEQFTKFLSDRMKEYPYVEVCGLDELLPTEIDFFWSWDEHINVVEDPEIL